jgi:hypothetical protein
MTGTKVDVLLRYMRVANVVMAIACGLASSLTFITLAGLTQMFMAVYCM